jgi:hypothetical protein
MKHRPHLLFAPGRPTERPNPKAAALHAAIRWEVDHPEPSKQERRQERAKRFRQTGDND